MKRFALLSFLVLMALVFQAVAPIASGFAAPASQTLTAEENAQLLLDSLQPEERVGQLFLVHFTGDQVNPESEIYSLVSNYHVGGVILRADHDNFSNEENILDATYDLVRNLQQIEWLSTQLTITDTIDGAPYTPAYIPLFVGISQPGDGAPYDQLLSGVTMLPSPAAIGATWDLTLAEQIGLIAGQELSALGINLYLGPSLDVLENPKPESGGDLGIRTFGGDPFWVGRLGSAYVKGLHAGSSDRIAVIAKHFPGVGGSDRPIEEEVPTVRKSLEQLKQIELAPFFTVTGGSVQPESTVDGLLISHIRYQGFFGNIRATTRPVSFDEASFSEIMGLAPFASWRAEGGIMISDDLGSRAVRRFYDPSGLSFNARLVVRDAFLAGNDMLYLGDILDTGDANNATSVIRILDFFTQKYREDSTFAQRVDEAVLRILTLKFKLYENFVLGDVIPNIERLEQVGNHQQTVLTIARESAAIISPGLADLDNVLPEAPALDARIVFITDTQPYVQCSTCSQQTSLTANELEQAVLRLYGPEAGNQVQLRNLSAYDFDALSELLDGETTSRLENDLRNTSWIVISMQDVNTARPSSLALRRLLSERDDLLRGKNVIVFAFNAPYFLDATNISKLTAYYALFTKTPQAVEIAARILFKEFIPSLGASPISISGTGYDLISATSPDPDQVIPLSLTSPVIELTELEETNPDQALEINLGEQLVLETGVILDHNGNPVPDGTPVQFVFNLNGNETLSPSVITTEGIARMTYMISEPGSLGIGLQTEPRAGFVRLEIAIPTPEGFNTPVPTTPTPEAAPSESPTEAPTQAVIMTPEPPAVEPRTSTDLVDWFIALLVSGGMGLIAYRMGSSAGLSRWSIRLGLGAAIGGLLSYLYLAFNLTGTPAVIEAGRNAMIWVVVIGSMAGWAFAATWYGLSIRLSPPRKTDPPKVAVQEKEQEEQGEERG